MVILPPCRLRPIRSASNVFRPFNKTADEAAQRARCDAEIRSVAVHGSGLSGGASGHGNTRLAAMDLFQRRCDALLVDYSNQFGAVAHIEPLVSYSITQAFVTVLLKSTTILGEMTEPPQRSQR